MNLDLFERLFGLGRILCGQDKLAIKLVEIGKQGVDRPCARLAVDQDLERLEIGLDRGPGHL